MAKKNGYLIMWFFSAALCGYGINQSMDLLIFCAVIVGYHSSRELSELS